MTSMTPESGALDEALRLHALGLRLVPLNGKVALRRNWPKSNLTAREIRSWHDGGVNWGIITGEPLIVLDTDSEAAEEWVRDKKIESPVMVLTGRGGRHRYFHCPPGESIHSRTRIHQIGGLDLRGWHSYVVAAGSIHRVTGRPYAYFPGRALHSLTALPIFDPRWIIDEPPPHPVRGSLLIPSSMRIRDVRRYVHAIPSIQGQGGDRACFTVACLLVEAGLAEDQMFYEMQAWNRECAFPPWSQKELMRKLQSARERVLRKKRCS